MTHVHHHDWRLPALVADPSRYPLGIFRHRRVDVRQLAVEQNIWICVIPLLGEEHNVVALLSKLLSRLQFARL